MLHRLDTLAPAISFAAVFDVLPVLAPATNAEGPASGLGMTDFAPVAGAASGAT